MSPANTCCTAAPYDATVSIGALERFVERDLPHARKVAASREFFASCHAWLHPGSALSLQTTAYDTLRPEQISAFITARADPRRSWGA